MSNSFKLLAAGIVSAAIALLFTGLSTIGLAQKEHDRMIEQQSFSNEPVKITVVKTKKGVIKIDEKFNDGTDWLKGLTITVENSSGKPITYVRVGLSFPRPDNHETSKDNPYSESLEYGVDPVATEGVEVINQIQALAPGKSIELIMPDEAYVGTKALLKELKFPENIKRVKVMVEAVGFEDGTVWNGGQFWRRDPTVPRGWSPIEKLLGSALNRTANFFGIRLSSPVSDQVKMFRKVAWVEPRPVQLPVTQCGEVRPEFTLPCDDAGRCRVPSRDYYGETGRGERVEVFSQHMRCRNANGSFCEPITQREVVSARPCPLSSPTPTPTPTPTPVGNNGCEGLQLCYEPEVYDPLTCSCVYPSPIIIDVAGDGFRLTAARGGVEFDINSDGRGLALLKRIAGGRMSLDRQVGWTYKLSVAVLTTHI